jgi:hypothetical protein
LSGIDTTALRTRDELADAIRGFSEADWGRLRKVAAAYARGRLIEADDLLQETFRRALSGRRKCPAHITVVKFLAETMRSIAHGDKEKIEKGPLLVAIPNHRDSEAGGRPARSGTRSRAARDEQRDHHHYEGGHARHLRGRPDCPKSSLKA